MIPKILHFVWVGDESKRPDQLIDTWRALYHDFEVRIYGNKDVFNEDGSVKRQWFARDKIREFWNRKEYCGIADIVRWQVLYNCGGIALDADSEAINRIPDWMLSCECIAAWSPNRDSNNLANGFVASKPKNIMFREMLHMIEHTDIKKWKWGRMKYKNLPAWQTTGPKPFTDIALRSDYHNITVLPSHFFYPTDKFGNTYDGDGPVYAKQYWGSTKQNFY